MVGAVVDLKSGWSGRCPTMENGDGPPRGLAVTAAGSKCLAAVFDCGC